MGYRVVVVGATGNVGREMLNILAERQFPADEVAALASRKSMGTEVSYGDKTIKTRTSSSSISRAGTSRFSPSGRMPRSLCSACCGRPAAS
jgi:aspartate-semialdehyde dehydrogenase